MGITSGQWLMRPAVYGKVGGIRLQCRNNKITVN